MKVSIVIPQKIRIFISRILIKDLENFYIFDTSTLSRYSSNSKINNIYLDAIERSEDKEFDTVYKKLKLTSLYQFVEQILDKDIEGDFAECGCWNGNSTIGISELIKTKSKSEREFYIFDSFEGLSDFTEKDITQDIGNKEQEELKIHFTSSYEKVKKRLSSYKFVRIYKGWIPAIFEKAKISSSKFAFVHIDVDLYEPTLESIKYFFPRLKSGGVLVCDDYGSEIFPGASEAINNYLKTISVDDILLKIEGAAGGIAIFKK